MRERQSRTAASASSDEPDRGEQEAGPVLAAGADGAGIRDRERGTFERERAEHRGDRRLRPRPEARVEQADREAEQRERDEPAAQQVVARPGAGLGRDERVDGGVQRDGRGSDREECGRAAA